MCSIYVVLCIFIVNTSGSRMESTVHCGRACSSKELEEKGVFVISGHLSYVTNEHQTTEKSCWPAPPQWMAVSLWSYYLQGMMKGWSVASLARYFKYHIPAQILPSFVIFTFKTLGSLLWWFEEYKNEKKHVLYVCTVKGTVPLQFQILYCPSTSLASSQESLFLSRDKTNKKTVIWHICNHLSYIRWNWGLLICHAFNLFSQQFQAN